ncbi:MAG: hypothetical protein LBL17_04450 [Coxiellaceae bacterium]|nr:hypothetical protein [Coxiellaceae bacterium]
MKTWLLKSDLSHSPQSALRMYASGSKKAKFNSDYTFAARSRQYFLVRRLKSQLKALSKLLTHETIAEIE